MTTLGGLQRHAPTNGRTATTDYREDSKPGSITLGFKLGKNGVWGLDPRALRVAKRVGVWGGAPKFFREKGAPLRGAPMFGASLLL